jgi:nucleoside-diphosphate-sugar epimerase
MAVTTLRPPLVYGPGVKGNFLRLMKLVCRRLPLPFASVENSRSLLYVGNLVSAIEKCLATPNGSTKTFLLSDGHDLSTPQLIAMIAAALGVRPHLIRFPVPMLLALGKITGKGAEVSRMVESLSIDCSHIKRQLQWNPPFTVEHGLEDTARWFLDTQK